MHHNRFVSWSTKRGWRRQLRTNLVARLEIVTGKDDCHAVVAHLISPSCLFPTRSDHAIVHVHISGRMNLARSIYLQVGVSYRDPKEKFYHTWQAQCKTVQNYIELLIWFDVVSVRFRVANLSVRSFNAARDCDSFHHTAATTAYSSLPSADYAARGALVLFPHLGSHSSVERFCCYCIRRALFQRQSQCRNPCRTHSSPSLMTRLVKFSILPYW